MVVEIRLAGETSGLIHRNYFFTLYRQLEGAIWELTDTSMGETSSHSSRRMAVGNAAYLLASAGLKWKRH